LLLTLPKFLLLPLALAVLAAGCASPQPTVSTWNNAPFAPARTDKIGLTLRSNPSPEDAELGRLLVTELKREGFDLVPIEQADYLLAYALEDDRVEVDNYRTAPPATMGPPQTTAQIISPPQRHTYGGPAPGVSAPPFVFHNQGIQLYLYTNPQTRPGGLQVAWQGYVSTGQTVSTEQELVLIQTLLRYWGQEHHGPVSLPK
jgi:hypothetical protein